MQIVSGPSTGVTPAANCGTRVVSPPASTQPCCSASANKPPQNAWSQASSARGSASAS